MRGKIFFIVGAVVLFLMIFFIKSSLNIRQNSIPAVVPAETRPGGNTSGTDVGSQNQNTAPINSVSESRPPLDRASERVTKKPFGIFVTLQNSPVQPEHFTGYHTGTDFEIFPEELNIDVQVKAVCSGKLLFKKYATGYGGVAVQACELEKQPITVVYGHLKPNSIKANIGDTLNASDALGILGKAYSQETGGERKHLHLGFHKGTAIDILGYVQNQAGLSGWLDPCRFVCGGW